MIPTDPFPASDFDAWAPTYDQDVLRLDTFPFAGYERVLDSIVEHCSALPGMSVLDLGIGTGNLAQRFAALGCKIWGSDYSGAMLDQVHAKLPDARLVLHDLRAAWPSELDRRFDRIVSAYTFHHFSLNDKVSLIAAMLREHLTPGGVIVIGDISFSSASALTDFAASIGDLWEVEDHWVADESLAAFARADLRGDYQQISPCAGVYRIEAH